MGFRSSMRERRRVARVTDMYEGAYSRMDQAREAREIGDPHENLPPGLQHGRRRLQFSRRTWVIIAVLVVIVVIFGLGGMKQRTPSLAASCTSTELKLSTTSARSGSNVTWTATGPTGRYVLAVDAATVTVDSGGVSVQPDVGGNGAHAALAGQPFSMASCTASGRFAFALPAGDHTLRMFRLDDGAPRVVRTQGITVTNSGSI